MDRYLSARSSGFTIASCATMAGLCSVIAAACTHAPLPSSDGLRSLEAPAPHLRGVAGDMVAAGPRLAEDEPYAPSISHPIPDGSVSLGHILVFADHNAPALTVARSARSQAVAAGVAAAVLLPTNPEISVSADPRIGLTVPGADTEVALQQQIQIAGERGLRIDAANRFGEVTDADIEQARWAVHCDVHAAFHRALVDQERAGLAQRVVAFQQDVLRVVERQISAGETAPLTLRLAQAEVAQAQQVLVASRQAFLASRIRLAQLAGWPVQVPPLPAGAVDAPREPPALDQLTRLAQERLPALHAVAARIREARARAALADREAWPRPSVGVQYRPAGDPTVQGVYDRIMGFFSLPIPSFQRNQGERAKSRADVTMAEANFSATRRLLDGQIAEARSETVAAAERTKAYGMEIVPRFEENLTLLRRSFELGEIDILALSAGRERFLRIQSDALLAQQDYFVALAGLERVVGVDLWRDDHHEESMP